MRTIKSRSANQILKLLFFVLIAGAVVLNDAGCKSSKAAKAKAAEEARAKAQADEEARRKADRDATAAKVAADAKAAAAKKEPYDRIENYFQQVANAGDVTNANQVIATALQSFLSPDIPVLIIIYRSGSTVDYDQPTTIGKYLAYIKDQKKNPNSIDHLEMDTNGKITEVILLKK